MTNSYDIFWIEGGEANSGNEPNPGIALVLRPYGGDLLDDELQRMHAGGIDTLVSMQELDEAEYFELAEEGEAANRAGMNFISFPIPDHHVPSDDEAFREFIVDLESRVKGGERVGVHCQGSIGRATVTAASLLIHLGWDPKTALEAIEAARGCEVPDTPEQREWILRYKVGNSRSKSHPGSVSGAQA